MPAILRQFRLCVILKSSRSRWSARIGYSDPIIDTLGFSLDEVRGLLAFAEGTGDACEQVQLLAQYHLSEIASKIADLTTMQAVLGALVIQCSQGNNAACSLITALSDDERHQIPQSLKQDLHNAISTSRRYRPP
jgi:DNA-binding transcriptional MerR regulator